MSAANLNKSRKKKQRRLQELPVVPLGDKQASHEYEHKDDEELRLESVLFGTPLAGSSSNVVAGERGLVDTSISHLLDEEVSITMK